MRQLAAQSQVIELCRDRVQLRLGVQSLVTEANRRLLEERLKSYFGGPFRVEFEAGETARGSTVAEADQERRIQERRELVERFAADPLVKEVLRRFGGEVDPGSIRPRKVESGKR